MTSRAVDRAVAETAEAQAGAFSSEQVVRAGGDDALAARRQHSGAWDRLARGVYRLRGAPVTWPLRLWAAHLEAGSTSVLSHASAAQVMGVPGWPPDRVVLTKVRGLHHEVTLSTLHETSWLPPHHVVRIGPYPPSTSIARIVFDLAGDPAPWMWRSHDGRAIHRQKVERLLNHAMVHHGLTIEKEGAILTELGRRGRPGSAVIRALLTELGPQHVPTESDLEDLYLSVVRTYGLPAPERQVVLGDDTYQGRVDFLYRAASLIVEVDGRWHAAPLERKADGWRDNRFAAIGLRTLRFDRRDLVREPGRVARTVRAALAAAEAA